MARLLRLATALLFASLAGAASTVASTPPASGGVRVEICEEGIPKNNTWPTGTVTANESFQEDAFGFFVLPQKYISTGVRADRAFPTLVRASAPITLPAGKHRLLLRSRGMARLKVDGIVVLETPFDQPRQFAVGNAGELPVEEQNTYLDLGPGYRFAPPGNREVWGEVTFTGATTEVVLETLIGGIELKSKKPFRPELGETVVAVALAGTNAWHLLAPGGTPIPYTDAAWAAYRAEREPRFDAMNVAARAARRAAHADYWNRRRDAARAWLAGTPEVPVPALPAGFPEHNAIDRFLGARLAQAVAEYAPVKAKGGVDYFRDIKPILEASCYSCHQGSKVKGGLRLDLRTEALQGGNADGPAIVPHRPETSALIQRILSPDPDEAMPAKGDRLPDKDIALLKQWIAEGAVWPDFPVDSVALTPLADDLTFLRRVYLDTIGLTPSEAEVAAFRADRSPDRRTRIIDHLLADPRWADHQMGYWLDVLAENPNLINPTLNNTGPFRWWIHESLRDNKPLDLFVTELLRLEGSERFGGPAGFGIASQNDVPMAAKGIIVSSAFLGVEMKCARCHDAPTHVSKQKELFALAAMLEAKPIKVPATSSVPLDHLRVGGREPLIQVTLQPGSTVAPEWPFAQFCDEQTVASLAEEPTSSRDRLAALITAPQNERFAQVMVNRIWHRLMGRGIVETIGDWEKSTPSHPDLLRWLAREFVRSGYDMKAIARLILTSHAYQRAVDPKLKETSPLFAAPAPRRIGAEQLVDSLFAATGKPFALEPVNLDLDSVRTIDNALDLGHATRAWMLASTSNERDRPSLMLPRNQAVSEVMEVFGWRGARPDAASGARESAANVLQPALLSNGTMMNWLTRLSDDHGLTRFALEAQPLDQFVERLFLRLFTRPPTAAERDFYVKALQPGYATRIVANPPPAAPPPHVHRKFVAWSNHMKSEANSLRLEEEAAARRGDPPTAKLDPQWRERFEDVLWALLNAPEWTHVM
jgi:mono/diheme cytochrome c family protein